LALSLSCSLFSLSFLSCAARDKFLLKKHILLFLNRKFYTIFQVTASLPPPPAIYSLKDIIKIKIAKIKFFFGEIFHSQN
jgi:hypothetical protein